MIVFISSLVKNFTILDSAPVAVIFIQARPFAPNSLTNFVSPSISDLENFAPPVIQRPLTTLPFSITFLKTPKPQFASSLVKSFISILNLVSGLSLPNLNIASS